MFAEATNQVVYVVGNANGSSIIDSLLLVDGNLVTQFGRQSVGDIKERYPTAKIASYEEAKKEVEASFITAPVEISEEDWNYYLGVLPPLKWNYGTNVETFHLSEMTYGKIGMIFCRIGDKRYSLQDKFSMNQIEIYEKVLASLEFS